jgi:hypothetical protein
MLKTKEKNLVHGDFEPAIDSNDNGGDDGAMGRK